MQEVHIPDHGSRFTIDRERSVQLYPFTPRDARFAFHEPKYGVIGSYRRKLAFRVGEIH
jgi:hypothetical protein